MGLACASVLTLTFEHITRCFLLTYTCRPRLVVKHAALLPADLHASQIHTLMPFSACRMWVPSRGTSCMARTCGVLSWSGETSADHRRSKTAVDLADLSAGKAAATTMLMRKVGKIVLPSR